jgi:hypothetical protein
LFEHVSRQPIAGSQGDFCSREPLARFVIARNHGDLPDGTSAAVILAMNGPLP